jgi:hypothetical protein
MGDTEPQTAGGKVLWHFTTSLDGFVLGGRDGWDAAGDSRPYGGAWHGPILVLTHHPEDATPADGVTFLNCRPAEAVRIGLAAAGGKNVRYRPTTTAKIPAESVSGTERERLVSGHRGPDRSQTVTPPART